MTVIIIIIIIIPVPKNAERHWDVNLFLCIIIIIIISSARNEQLCWHVLVYNYSVHCPDVLNVTMPAEGR